MKVTVSREALIDGMSHVQSIVGNKSSLDILGNVLIQAEDGKVSMQTTDLDISIRAVVQAEVDKPGATTLPAKRLFGLCRELPAHEIEIEIDDRNAASIRSGTSFFKIFGQSASEFPNIPEVESPHSFQIEQASLKAMLRQTMYAASTDETRYILNGALLSFRDEKLTVVCTDGRRLALVEQELEFPSEAEVDLVIPTKVVQELVRSLEEDGTVKVWASDNQVAFEFGDMLMLSKLIDGKFPNYRQVIPGACEERIPIEREALLAAVRRASLLVNEVHGSVKLSFVKNRLEVSTSAQEIGEAQEKVPIKYGGKDITVSFNPGFLQDALKVLPYDTVYLELTDELSPGVLKCDGAFLYVIMPMRLAGG